MSAPAPALDPSLPNKGLLTVSMLLAALMQILDSTIANVALPDMQASLGAAQDTITWVLTSYIVASAIALPLTGWLSDRIGLKRLFLISVGGFVVASMLCGIAVSLAEMVIFRVLQGVFGAFIVPLLQTVLLAINPREKQGQAMAIFGVGMMVGPVLGPVLGGVLTENLNWRWVFYVNLPVGLIAFAGIWLFMPRRPTTTRRFDLFGFAFLALGIAALQMMLDRGQQLDWFDSLEIVAYAAISITALWVFGVHVATAHRVGREPILSMEMVRNRNLMIAYIFTVVLGMLMFSGVALLPPMLEHLFGYPIITTGLVMAPRGVGTMISMFIAGQLTNRVDPRLILLAGCTLMAVSFHMMAGFSLDMDTTPVVVSGVVQGFGMGLLFVPLSTLAFATLSPRLRTDGSSFYTLVRNIGSSIGISIVTALVARSVQVNHAELGGHVTETAFPFDPRLTEQLGGAGAALASAADAMINRQALMIAYTNSFQLLMWMSIAVMPLLMLLKRPATIARDPTMVHAD